jgi:hypothetical protein
MLPIVVALAMGVPNYLPRALELEPGLAAEAPWLAPEEVAANAVAAARAETPDVPAELLLAVAWRESRYEPTAGPQCGVVQVTLRGAPCRRLLAAGLAAQYRAGARAIERWIRLVRRMGRPGIRNALLGYAEGVAAVRRGYGIKGCSSRHCDRSSAVLARARRIWPREVRSLCRSARAREADRRRYAAAGIGTTRVSRATYASVRAVR